MHPEPGTELCESHTETVARVARFSARPAVSYIERSIRSPHGERRERKGLKLAELRLRMLRAFSSHPEFPAIVGAAVLGRRLPLHLSCAFACDLLH